MLFSSKRVRNIWILIAEELKLTLKLETYCSRISEQNTKSDVRNLVITIMTYSIYTEADLGGMEGAPFRV